MTYTEPMLKRIRQSYFADHNYTLIYIHHFFFRIASNALYIFTGAYFLDLGMALPFVLLFYGLEFGLRGALCPFGVAIINRLGLLKSMIMSSTLMIMFFIGLSFADQNLWLGFGSLIFAAMAGAIYYPFLDILEAIFIKEDHNRTKQLSVGIILRSMGGVVGSIGVGYLLTYYDFNAVVLFVAISKILAVLPFLKLRASMQYLEDTPPAQIFKFLVSKEFKPLWPALFGQQLIIIFRSVMVPLILFSLVGKMDSLGYLVALTLIAEQIFTLMAGHYTDKFGVQKMIRTSRYSYGLALIGYMALAKTPLLAFFVETYQKITLNIFNGAFVSGMHAHARRNHGDHILLFGAGFQMALCFGELLVLPLYGLAAYFIGNHIFYVSCAGAMIGTLIVTSSFRKQPLDNSYETSHKSPSNNVEAPLTGDAKA